MRNKKIMDKDLQKKSLSKSAIKKIKKIHDKYDELFEQDKSIIKELKKIAREQKRSKTS